MHERITRRAWLQRAAAAASLRVWPASAGPREPALDRPRDPVPAYKKHVSWLADVQRPPRALEAAPPLAPLVDDAGRPFRSPEEWAPARTRLHQKWRAFLGPMPDPRPPLDLEILAEETFDGGTRQRVRYRCEPDATAIAWLLRPAAGPPTARRPAVVALHPTNRTSIEEIAGLDGNERNHLGVHLCRAGFVVVCPRCFLWDTPPEYTIDTGRTVAEFQKRHPRARGMAKMLYDAQRAVDLLASLPDVDPARIGACGHSLGAKETLYLAAFDTRIRAAAASEGGIGFRSTNWDAPWYLGKEIHEPGFALNHHQLVALTAPRALLVLAGETGPGAADGDRSWPYLEAALPIYRLYAETAPLGLDNHREGHTLSERSRSRLIEWLATYLAD